MQHSDCVCVFYKSGHFHCNAFTCIFFESTACILSRSGVVYIYFFFLSVAYYLDPTEIDSCDDTNELYLKGKWIFCDTGSQLLLHYLFHFLLLCPCVLFTLSQLQLQLQLQLQWFFFSLSFSWYGLFFLFYERLSINVKKDGK